MFGNHFFLACFIPYQVLFNYVFITLQVMLPIFLECCDDMVSKWERLLSSNDKSEIDVWPFLQNLTCDIISRTAFGSSYEDGKRIFELLKEQTGLMMKLQNAYIPGWWYDY